MYPLASKIISILCRSNYKGIVTQLTNRTLIVILGILVFRDVDIVAIDHIRQRQNVSLGPAIGLCVRWSQKSVSRHPLSATLEVPVIIHVRILIVSVRLEIVLGHSVVSFKDLREGREHIGIYGLLKVIHLVGVERPVHFGHGRDGVLIEGIVILVFVSEVLFVDHPVAGQGLNIAFVVLLLVPAKPVAISG